MKIEKNCRACELEREIEATRADRTLKPDAKAVLCNSLRKSLGAETHTCRNPRNSRTRGA